MRSPSSEWRSCRVGIDYHVEVAAHYYSVPYRFARAEVDVRLTARTGRDLPQGRTDCRAHGGRQSQAHDRPRAHALQPPAIRRLDDRSHSSGRSPDRTGDDGAVRTDPRTAPASQTRLSRLSWQAGPYGPERLEAAAERAIDIGARTYGSVKSILNNHLDRRPAHKRATDATPILHSNIRGPRYYN